ncbi:MAG: hypothetical protein JRI56_00980 [Deltaproteobacteria bacterium]|nr:hypothetical protein [Deltaproteobacteria bacterium]
MKEAGWTVRIMVRYILLQIPGTALLVLILIQLRNWFDLPAWSAWGLVVISVAKDVILFPFVWRAYDWDRQGETHLMVGKRGTIEKGEAVWVKEMQGLTLLVRPYKKSNE